MVACICPSDGLAVEVGPFLLGVVLQVPPTFHCSARDRSAGPGITSLISFLISVGFSATPVAHLSKKLCVPAEAITVLSVHELAKHPGSLNGALIECVLHPNRLQNIYCTSKGVV